MFYDETYLGQPAAPSPAGEASNTWGRRRRLPRRAGAGAAVLMVAVGAAGIGRAVSGTSVATSGTSAATLSVPQVEAMVDPALVDIVTTLDYGSGEAAGTGMVLTPSGEILTNNHVVEGATTIRVTDVGNARTYSARVVGYDATADVAVLQLNGALGLKTVSLGNSTALGAGASVVALGNAGGIGGKPSAATGTVTALSQSIAAADEFTGTAEQLHGLIATDAAIQAGDSGGPLVDMHGQVVGMDTAGSSSFQFQPDGYGGGAGGAAQGGAATTGYAVPSNAALAVVSQIEAGRASSSVHIGPSAFLGVQVSAGGRFYSQWQGVAGALIAGVVPGSPAAASGLATYDTITSVGGKTVSSASSLPTVMNEFHPGQHVTVTWVDPYGASHTAKLTLAGGPVG